MNAVHFFDLKATLADRLLSSAEYPWQALDMLSEYIFRIGKGLDKRVYNEVKKGIWIAKSASVSESASLTAPLIIGEGSEVGRLACLGGSLIIGKGVTVGNLSEIKSSVLFDGARLSQNNYISDSIIGCKVSFGAGAIVSNLSANRKEIICALGEISVKCERARFGAIIGDGAEIGCSSVLSAGTVVEPGAKVGPLTRARGFVSAAKAYKGEKIIADIL